MKIAATTVATVLQRLVQCLAWSNSAQKSENIATLCRMHGAISRLEIAQDCILDCACSLSLLLSISPLSLSLSLARSVSLARSRLRALSVTLMRFPHQTGDIMAAGCGSKHNSRRLRQSCQPTSSCSPPSIPTREPFSRAASRSSLFEFSDCTQRGVCSDLLLGCLPSE